MADMERWFDETTFELMALLHATPTASFYLAHKAGFKVHVEAPLQRLFRTIALRLPRPMVSLLETEKNVFARIIKNDFGRGGAWDYYWGAFYPRGGRRITGAQLFLSAGHDGVRAGFYIGQGSDQRERCGRNCRAHAAELADLLQDSLAEPGFTFGERSERDTTAPAWHEWLNDPEAADFVVMVNWPPERVLQMEVDALSAEAVRVYERLFPLVLLAVEEEPMEAIQRASNDVLSR
jgi:5-methylcytosine-specific restriction enzyme B